MSKKSRRRNKKILGALALIGGLGMAARNKRNKAIDKGIKSAEADKGSDMIEFKEQVVSTPSVYQDPIMKGGKGVKVSRIRNPKSTFIVQCVHALIFCCFLCIKFAIAIP